MKLEDLFEAKPSRPAKRAATPLSGTTEDDLNFAVREVAFLSVRLKGLPSGDLVRPVVEQLEALGRTYQAEIAERRKARVK